MRVRGQRCLRRCQMRGLVKQAKPHRRGTENAEEAKRLEAAHTKAVLELCTPKRE